MKIKFSSDTLKIITRLKAVITKLQSENLLAKK
ncbi:hypothetical protein JOD96_001015 [Flavobacterium sp. 1355]|nr:hypothetical protein [Flavobacterium sp. 1355]